MRARAWPAAVLLACIGTALTPVLHAQGGGSAAAATGEELILTVRANGVSRGEFTLLQTSDGDFWIAAEDLPRLRVQPDEAARRRSPAGEYYSLRALTRNNLRFDEANLAITLDFVAGELEQTRIDLSGRPPPVEVTRPPTSTILNYRVGVREADGTPVQLRMTGELNMRMGEVLFRQQAKVETGRGLPAFARGDTQLIWDDRLNGRRVTAGDQLTAGGPFGTIFPAAGISLTKVYAITPDVLRQPTASLQVTAATPSQVEVAVDGSPIYRTTVPPGPVTLQNLHYFSGVRNLRVTVIDASGQRQVYEHPFFFTDEALAKGMHEYSYFAGRRAELGSDDRWRYREPAWQAFHRYGVSDHLTVEAGGEGTNDFADGGAGLLLRSDTLGLLSLGRLASLDRVSDRTAQGWRARYIYVAPEFTVFASRRQLEREFRTFAPSGGLGLLRETRVGGSARLSGSTNVSFDYTRTTDTLGPRQDYAVRLAATLTPRSTLFTEYTRSQSRSAGNTWGVAMFLRVELERQHWVGGNFRAGPGLRTVEAEVGKQLPQGEGVGYRVGTLLTHTGSRQADFAQGAATWNLRNASVDVNASAQTRGGNAHFAEAGVNGALVSLDGYVGATRQVADGFALARLGVPQPGVEIFLNSQVQGKTDADGNLLIPNVGAFGRQDVTLNDRQLSMEYSVGRKRVTIAPPFRSGTLVTFGGHRLRAVSGQAWLLEGGTRKPIESHAWTVAGPAGRLAIETAPSGDFYLEDAAPGRYSGTVRLNGKVYSCTMEIPNFAEAVHELQDGLVCQ